MPKFTAQDADRILTRLDKIAGTIQTDYEKWGMDLETAREIVQYFDETSDMIEVASFGQESFAKRQAERDVPRERTTWPKKPKPQGAAIEILKFAQDIAAQHPGLAFDLTKLLSEIVNAASRIQQVAEQKQAVDAFQRGEYEGVVAAIDEMKWAKPTSFQETMRRERTFRDSRMDEATFLKKADLCTTVARMILQHSNPTTDDIEAQAVSLMYMPNADLVTMASRLAATSLWPTPPVDLVS